MSATTRAQAGLVVCATPPCVLVEPPRYRIFAEGRIYPFEMHPYCGPAVVHKRTGDPLPNQPPERCLFWAAVTRWNRQGRQVGPDGLCIWRWEPAQRLKKFGGRSFLVSGNDDGWTHELLDDGTLQKRAR